MIGMHRAGFVNIVGNPNVGKSTLMNALVGERISIITSKAQTTRHRIMGIVNGDDFQIVYSDTPGVLKPNYKLQESMLGFSNSALTDADILLYVTDVLDSAEKNAFFLEKVQRMQDTTKIILIVNKIDLIDQEKLEALVDFWHKELPKAEIFPISALEKLSVMRSCDQAGAVCVRPASSSATARPWRQRRGACVKEEEVGNENMVVRA